MEGIFWILDFVFFDFYYIFFLIFLVVFVVNVIFKDKIKFVRMFGKVLVVNLDEKFIGKEEFCWRLMFMGVRLNFWFLVFVGLLMIGLLVVMYFYWIMFSLGNWMVKRLFDLVWLVEKLKELMRMRLELYFIYFMLVEKKKLVVEVVKMVEIIIRLLVVMLKRVVMVVMVVKNDVEVLL